MPDNTFLVSQDLRLCLNSVLSYSSRHETITCLPELLKTFAVTMGQHNPSSRRSVAQISNPRSTYGNPSHRHSHHHVLPRHSPRYSACSSRISAPPLISSLHASLLQPIGMDKTDTDVFASSFQHSPFHPPMFIVNSTQAILMNSW